MGRRSRSLVQTGWRTDHNRIVTCGILVLLFFLPTWIAVNWHAILQGSSTFLLNIGFLYLGLDALWKRRHQIQGEPAVDEERIFGYFLILSSAACFPFCLSSISLQALLCMVILIGIAICNWGIALLQRNLLSVMLILIGVYPDLTFLVNSIRKSLTGDQLEYFMAWLSGLVLSAIGQPVSVEGALLSLSKTLDPQKSVLVASGCSGFDMAFPIAGFAFIMGMFFKQPWHKIFALMGIGIALALVFNVPRIMLLAFAVVYWGKDSFEFWHGPIGGQVFSTIMLTIYYYIAMAIINQKPKQISSK